MLNASRRTWPNASIIIAGKSALSEFIVSIETWRLSWARKRASRRAIRHLLTLDDRLLDDIGLSRSDLMAGSGRPPINHSKEWSKQC